MADTTDFRDRQYAFAAHIRDPEHNPAPGGIEDRRMAIYRELFFNNLYKLLGSTFPVLRKLYGPDGWRRLTRAFMINYRAKTPYFLEISKEFLDFLKKDYARQDDDPAFLTELAHYEWAELALSVSDAQNDTNVDPDGDLLAGVPVKSVHAWPLNYRFPVHRINESFKPEEPPEQATFLVVFRRDDYELGFMELNPLTARLLEMIATNDDGLSGRELLASLAAEAAYPDPDGLQQHGAEILADMRERGILTGTRA